MEASVKRSDLSLRFYSGFERSLKICQLDLYMFEEVCRLMENWAWRSRTDSVSATCPDSILKGRTFERFYEIAQKYHIPPKAIGV